jgi:cytochrome c oxidase subunit 2
MEVADDGSQIRFGTQEQEMAGMMKDRVAAGYAALTVAMLGLLYSASAWAVEDMPGGPGNNAWNLPGNPATSIARGQQWIHEVLLWVSVAICVIVFGAMFYAIFAFRKSKGSRPADFHESTVVEVAWTIVPFVIVVGLAIAATEEVIAQKDTTNAYVTVKATGYQWKWGYEYLNGEGEGINFLSNLTTTPRRSTTTNPRT